MQKLKSLTLSCSSVYFSDLTTINAGGKASDYNEFYNETELIGFFTEQNSFNKSSKKKLLILGGGSNLICSTKNFSGTVVRYCACGVFLKKSRDSNLCTVRVQAGATLDSLVEWCVENEISGLEFLSGIPGFVGGAVVQNSGAYGSQIGDFIKRVKVFDFETKKTSWLLSKNMEYDYRDSVIKKALKKEPLNPKHIVIEAEFALKSTKISIPIKYKDIAEKLNKSLGESDLVSNVRKAVLETRKEKGTLFNKKDPLTYSCGSYFLNPTVDGKNQVPENAPNYKTIKNEYKISAAWLIENSGIKKGYKLDNSGVQISPYHNLIIINTKNNNDNANAKSVIKLGEFIQKTVYKKFGIMLVPEPIII